MRPDQPWGDVVRVLNGLQAAHWTVERQRARYGGVSLRVSLRPAYWTGRDRSGATIGSSGWSSASRRPHQGERCNRSPPSSRPCENVRRGVERAGIRRPLSTCWIKLNGSA